MAGSSGYVDIEYISNIPYFRGVATLSASGCTKGIITSKSTQPSNRASTLLGRAICELYTTNEVSIKY